MLWRQFVLSILFSVCYFVLKLLWGALSSGWTARFFGDRSEDTPWWEVPPLEVGSSDMTVLTEPSTAMGTGKCDQCGQKSVFRCSMCKVTKYCAKECQQAHWLAKHKRQCLTLKSKALEAKSGSSAVAAKAKPAVVKKEEPDEVAPVPKKVLFSYDRFLSLYKDVAADEDTDDTDDDVDRRDSVSIHDKPPLGLTNNGNTCFANSLLQCLMRTRPLLAFFKLKQHSPTCSKPSPSSWCLMCEMEKLVGHAQEGSRGDVVNPRAITRSIRSIAPHFTVGRQEDSHDLFVNMVDKMESIMLHEAGGRQAFDMRSRETTLVGHTFNGYVRYQTICSSCGHPSQRFDTKVGLEIQLTKQVCSLQSGLDAFFEEEVLDADNRYKCGRCKEQVCARRVSHIEVAPNVLAVTLKRFGLGRYGKITKMVTFPEELDLDEYKADDAMDTVPALYQLFGVLVHIDSMSSTMFGHYISYVRCDNGAWYLCDDSSVRKVSSKEALSQKAYMLFYLRKQPHHAPDPSFSRPPPSNVSSQTGVWSDKCNSTTCNGAVESTEADANRRADPVDEQLPVDVGMRGLKLDAGGTHGDGDAGQKELAWRLCFRTLIGTADVADEATYPGVNGGFQGVTACIYADVPMDCPVQEVQVQLESGPPIVACLKVPGFQAANVPLLQPLLASRMSETAGRKMEQLLEPVGAHSSRLRRKSGQLKLMVNLAPKPGLSRGMHSSLQALLEQITAPQSGSGRASMEQY